MKYLKRFNENSSILYEKIYEQEYNNNKEHRWVDFDRNLYSKLEEYLYEGKWYLNYLYTGNLDGEKELYLQSDDTEDTCYIYETSDEWFYVCYTEVKKQRRISENFYKCDQTEGLLQVLKIYDIIK